MRRMLTKGELFANLKSYFVNKTNAGVETMAGSLLAKSLFSVNGSSSTGIIDLGVVNSTDLISTKIAAGAAGIYSYYINDTPVITMIKFVKDNSKLGGISLLYDETLSSVIRIITAINYSGVTFGDLAWAAPITRVSPVFSAVTSINASLNGTPTYAIENATLHIRGSFTPTATIAAGSKLFSTGQTLAVRAIHDSAINTGTITSITAVGISISTSGDVYCLGELTAGVTYNIAVTATL